MNASSVFRIRIYFTVFVSLGIASILVWNYTHGGVPGHHILADKTLPRISNWWGLILLPSLTWFLSYRIQRRILNSRSEEKKQVRPVVIGFLIALLFAIVISTSFTLGHSDLTGNILLLVFPLGLFLPLYRSECLLGFVIGMTFTFGAVLPTAFGSVLVLICALIYLYVRSGILFIASRFKQAEKISD